MSPLEGLSGGDGGGGGGGGMCERKEERTTLLYSDHSVHSVQHQPPQSQCLAK